MVTSEKWVDRSACRRTDPEVFFPDNWNARTVNIAREVCADCPVTLQCLRFAIANYLDHGMFGGTTPEQRKRLRGELGIIKPRAQRDTLPHGTLAAVRRHQRNHTTMCDQCKPVKAAYDAARNVKRREKRRAARMSA